MPTFVRLYKVILILFVRLYKVILILFVRLYRIICFIGNIKGAEKNSVSFMLRESGHSTNLGGFFRMCRKARKTLRTCYKRDDSYSLRGAQIAISVCIVTDCP